MTRIFIIIYSFLLLNSCTENSISIELRNNFTETEIRDLIKLTEFFKEQMCSFNNDLRNCIDSLNPHLSEYGWNPILENIDFEKQKKIYESFESNLFNEIWSFCKTSKRGEEIFRKSICLNTNGKYLKFIEEIGNKNGVLNEYKNSLIMTGDFMDINRIQNEIINKSEKIDLNDFGIQVLIVIDYLTQNDQQKRNDIWTEN